MNPPLPVSVLVQTKNEEVGIRACLDGLGDFDEIIVVDSQSPDRTAEIARAHRARVIDFAWNGQYPKKKQWQLDNVVTRHPWVLFLDADESPTEDLVTELRAIFADGAPREAAFDLPLRYWFAGRPLSYGHRVVKRALVHRDRVRFPVIDDLDLAGMGELEGHYQPVASGPVRRLRSCLDHRDLDPVRSWFDRHNRYSDWEAGLQLRRATQQNVARRRSRQGRLFANVPGKPLVFFLYSYFGRAGILDGRAGLDYALALTTYYWQTGLKVRELERSGAERA